MATNKKQYEHWHYHVDEHDILWLGFDRANKTANSLSCDAVSEFRKILDTIANNNIKSVNSLSRNKILGVIIYSLKSNGFIAGADVTEFKDVNTTSAARDILENGQNTMNELAKLKIPTVAMIDGFCLGGGFELALACHYRVATDDAKTKLGLPEVMLGIIPGWGGTVRLVKLIGPVKGLPLIMQGRTVSSQQAAKLGMIDACVPKRQLLKTAKYFILHKPSKHNPNWFDNLFNYPPFRNIFAYFAEKQLRSKISSEHYPAPYGVLANWKKHGTDGVAPFKAEINADLEIIQKPTAKNLIRAFFLQEQLKEQAKIVDFKAKHVHVIGGGTMGGDIAAWCALKGIKVTLQDRSYEALTKAMKNAYDLFKAKLKKHDLAQLVLDKITPDINGDGIKNADVIIEAVFEDLKVKQDLFKMIESKAKPEAILATNTSSILLDDINQVLVDKSRLVGIHFFNPVAKMMLVEVVCGKVTNKNVLDKSCSFVNQIAKLPIPVASSPGFLVNRVLAAYMHETFILLSEGNKPEVIDNAMKQFGMLMGPVEMADIVGLDICLSVAKNISKYYNEEIPGILEHMVANNSLGKKTNKGFYHYKNGKIIKNKVETRKKQDEIIERLSMRILNICVTCLREGVVTNQELVDAGLIFGAGFAPFRGGPMNYLNIIGKEEVLRTLSKLQDKFGVRFKPDTGFDNINKGDVRGSYEQACG